MKRIVAILLCIITLMSAVACNGESKQTAPTTPKNETPSAPESFEFPIVKNGKAAVYVTIPDGYDRFIEFARAELKSAIADKTGVNVLSGTMSDQDYEIMLGDTSSESMAIVNTLKDNEFSITTSGKRIYILAKNNVYLVDAVKYFTENYLSGNEYADRDKDNLVIKKELSAVVEVTADGLFYKLGGNDLSLTATVEEIARLERYSATIYRKQGGCFTGKYYYQAFISQSENEAVIGRINIETGAVRYSKPMYLDHANDITYDLSKQEIYVGASTTVYVFDMGTLEFKEKIPVGVSAGRIAYSAEKGEWVLGSFYRFKKLTDETCVKKFDREASVSSYTTQGITADGHYIYSLLCEGIGSSKYRCYVAVYDWQGNYVGKITVKIPNDYEPENISIVNGDLYIGNCSGDSFAFLYKVVLD